MASSTSSLHCITSNDGNDNNNSTRTGHSNSIVCSPRPRALSSHLEWIERGSSLIRRMNSERIAEDGRIRRLLMPAEYEDAMDEENDTQHLFLYHQSPSKSQMMQNANEPSTQVQQQEQEQEQEHAQAQSGDHQDNKEQQHHDHEGNDKEEEAEDIEVKPSELELSQVVDEAQDPTPSTTTAGSPPRSSLSDDLLASSTSLLSWTLGRVHSTLQNSLQEVIFPKAPEERFLVAIAPRVFCVSPAYINVFDRLFSSANLNRTWPAAEHFLLQLDASLSKRFNGHACVFDCGLFDGIKRVLHRSLLYDEFCDGKVSSIQFTRMNVPPMHSLFIVASTVSSWLELDAENIAVLIAPNNDHAAVFSTCCAIYCTNTLPIPERFGTEFLQVYQNHMHGSEGWGSRLQRTFSGIDSKTSTYFSSIPRFQERVVTDFIKLLEIRDAELLRKRQKLTSKLTGVAVTPAIEEFHIHKIVLLSCAREAGINFNYRPYFVLQNDKGVVFSSMVNVVRSISLAEGPHMYPVCKSIKGRDLLLRMYHLPFGRKGELILDCRLHIGLLLHSLTQRALDKKTAVKDTIGELTLSLGRGDFDAITTTRFLPRDFAVQIFYARDESAFPPTTDLGSSSLSSSSGSLDEESKGDSASLSPPRSAPARDSSSHLEELVLGSTDSASTTTTASSASASGSIEDDAAYQAAMASMASISTNSMKPARYNGPSGISFMVSHQTVQTVFGDGQLIRVDLTRNVVADQIELSLLFHVRLGSSSSPTSASSSSQDVKVLPYRHLFRFLLPVQLRLKLVEMGATEEALVPHLPLFFPSLHGAALDAEYARWLQRYFNAEQNDGSSEYDGEFLRGIPVTEIEPSDTYRIVSVPLVAADSGRSSSPPPTGLRGTARGASSSLISQLPTYVFSCQRPKADITTPDCLICRCAFIEGEEIKSLPCFHCYHSECIDSWLCLNKACPVCQFNVENCSNSN